MLLKKVGTPVKTLNNQVGFQKTCCSQLWELFAHKFLPSHHDNRVFFFF